MHNLVVPRVTSGEATVRCSQGAAMSVDEIRKLKEAIPFRPFKLVLANGDELLVGRRGAIAIAPEDKFLIYPLDPGGYRLVAPSDIRSADQLSDTAA
jgi:hypothetical protein